MNLAGLLKETSELAPLPGIDMDLPPDVRHLLDQLLARLDTFEAPPPERERFP